MKNEKLVLVEFPSEEDLNKLLIENNDLFKYGFYKEGEKNYDNTKVSYNEFAKCVNWLVDNINYKFRKNLDSYALKHMVENTNTGYIPSGCLIAAAIYLKAKVKRNERNAIISF
jgi:hypothetical protein